MGVEVFEVVRSVLAESRENGVDFARAWRLALARAANAVEPADQVSLWRVLDSTREAWEASYVGTSARRRHLAAWRAADLVDLIAERCSNGRPPRSDLERWPTPSREEVERAKRLALSAEYVGLSPVEVSERLDGIVNARTVWRLRHRRGLDSRGRTLVPQR